MNGSYTISRAVNLVMVSILAMFLVACVAFVADDASDSTPTPGLLADTFFTGCAYLDRDSDGFVDPDEPLVGGLLYEVALAGGAGFGGETRDSHCAVVIVPSALPPDAWPVVVRMVVPETINLRPIGPGEVTLQYPETRAEFLFVARQE